MREVVGEKVLLIIPQDVDWIEQLARAPLKRYGAVMALICSEECLNELTRELSPLVNRSIVLRARITPV